MQRSRCWIGRPDPKVPSPLRAEIGGWRLNLYGPRRLNYRETASHEGDRMPTKRKPPSPGNTADPSDGKSGASPSGPGLQPVMLLDDTVHSTIAARAYEIAKGRGFTPGHEIDDWLQAEREIEFGSPRNTPPDNPGDVVQTHSNE